MLGESLLPCLSRLCARPARQLCYNGNKNLKSDIPSVQLPICLAQTLTETRWKGMRHPGMLPQLLPIDCLQIHPDPSCRQGRDPSVSMPGSQ